MRKTVHTGLIVVLVVLLGGCTGIVDTQSETVATETTPQTTPANAVTTTMDSSVPTADTPPAGTQEVLVSRLENQSRYVEWPDNETIHFENLSEPRKAVFRNALKNGSVTFAPDEENPFSYYDESRPKVVKFEGSWYSVRVAIV